jgi:hypothetical protein
MAAVGEGRLQQKVRDHEQGVGRERDLQGMEQELACQ